MLGSTWSRVEARVCICELFDLLGSTWTYFVVTGCGSVVVGSTGPCVVMIGSTVPLSATGE